MIIGHIMSTSKILIDLYAIRGNIKTFFADIACNVAVV